MSKLQSVRGTKDMFGEQAALFQHVINAAQEIAEVYGFQLFQTPIMEFTEVFKRTLGETSDVVNKEMYTFEDRGGDSITLRPEFTAGIVRAFISNGLQQSLPVKAFSYGPLFRYERPQKGRQRQFHQLNFEWLGGKGPFADVELIIMAAHLLHRLGLGKKCKLLINTLGDVASREAYRNVLIDYFEQHKTGLSEDSQQRLVKNPLRILDSKDPADQEIVAGAPAMQDSLTDEAKQFFEVVRSELEGTAMDLTIGDRDKMHIDFDHTHTLVRGLDYYSHTVFEFVSHADELGSQNTVLAGGRYDGLVTHMGGPETPALGFAAGIERLMLMLEQEALPVKRPVALIIHEDARLDDREGATIDAGQVYAAMLRDNGIYTELYHERNMGKAMKKANKANAAYAIVIGPDEVARKTAQLKDMDSGVETELALAPKSFTKTVVETLGKQS